jgi:hypothetical protein
MQALVFATGVASLPTAGGCLAKTSTRSNVLFLLYFWPM